MCKIVLQIRKPSNDYAMKHENNSVHTFYVSQTRSKNRKQIWSLSNKKEQYYSIYTSRTSAQMFNSTVQAKEKLDIFYFSFKTRKRIKIFAKYLCLCSMYRVLNDLWRTRLSHRRTIRFLHLPPPSSVIRDTCWWQKGGGGGRGAKPYDREKAWSSINHSILSCSMYPNFSWQGNIEIYVLTQRSGFHKWSSLTWSYSGSPGVGAGVGEGVGVGAGAGAWAGVGAGGEGEHSSGRTPEGLEASRSCYTPFTESSAANWPVALFFFSSFRNLHCFFLSLCVTISFNFCVWNEWSQVTQGQPLPDTLFIT
jgi:hypothetical protein